MTQIEWMSDHGVRFILRIHDGSDTYTDLVPGATPFVTTIDTDDDLFCPVRTQTGIIQVATESVDIQAIVGKDPLSRAVTVVMFADPSSVEQRVWHGYLQTTAFTQTWDKGPNTIELPVWSALYALGARNPSNDVTDLTYINFARFLCDLVKPSDDALPVYRQFIFSSLTEPLTSLQYNFNLLNYATWNAELGQYDVKTYGEILADICKLFGWQVQEHGDALVFLTADTPSDYISMLWNQLDVLANGQTPIYDTITQTAEAQTIYGSQHTQTFLQGKRKVTVWGNVNDPGSDIFTMDLSKEKQGGHDHASWGTTGTTHYLTINYDNNAGNIFLTSQSDKNIKETDAKNQTTSGQGCCISHERMFETDHRTGSMSITSDSGWNDRIIWRFNNSAIGSNILSIYVPKRFFYTALQSGSYLTLVGDVEYAQNARDAWTNVADGAIELIVAVDSTVVGTYIVRIHDGKLSGGHTATAFGNLSGGFNIPMPTTEGQILIMMRVPTDAVLNTCNMTRTNYYSLRNFKVSINHQYWLPFDWQIPTRNIEKRDISQGFVDDYESECQLTTRVLQTDPAPSAGRSGSQALLRWSERGTGIILASTLTATPPNVLYADKTPEVALADRLVAYYKQSRKKITAYLRGDIPLAPWLMQKIGARTEQYVVLSQQMDWKRGQIAADLYEVPNDE